MNPTYFLVEFQRCLEACHEYSLSWCQENILGLHDCDLWWMRTLKHSYSWTVSSPSHISSWVLQSSLLGSFLKLGITDLDRDAKHNSKVFNSKTLGQRSDMLNKKFKIQRDLDRMECLNKANTIKLKVQYFTKTTVSTELSKLYLAAEKKSVEIGNHGNKDMPKVGPYTEALRWEMARTCWSSNQNCWWCISLIHTPLPDPWLLVKGTINNSLCFHL